ncbi:hypothetical protein GJ744_005320 [Endocarpon pusillum]|uniref:Uncharacterized protein n=1 Tax=Endocarpon pusillum TaxID=364733 RepID=A0A8H7E5D3_9EURO|nr:hypothetical protein GJ744_005320 [Endocarpon pusillum]
MTALLIFTTSTLAWVIWTVISLLSNYKAARRIGLPVIISPVSSLDPLWILTYRALPILRLFKSLPFGLGKWSRCAYMGWSFDDKYSPHKELDLAFALVTPSLNEVWIADPDAAHVVLSRRKEYIKSVKLYQPLNVFGPNLDTVGGEDSASQTYGSQL